MVQVDMEMFPTEASRQMAAQPEAMRTGVRSEAASSRVAEVLRVEDLRKEYATGRGRLVLFEDISFTVAQGDLLAIVGESGAGKSTLLHILGALDTATSGHVYFGSTLLKFPSPRQAADFRNREVGYVWQFHYLLPEFTAQENVAMPLLARGEPRKSAMAKAND